MLSGNVGGAHIEAQTAGSIDDSYNGTIDVTLIPGVSLQFNSAAADADSSSVGPFSSLIAAAGTSGLEDNYGIFVDGGAFGSIDGAVCDFVLNLTSVGPIALAGTSFDASDVTISTIGGVFDSQLGINPADSSDLVGNSVNNQASTGVL